MATELRNLKGTYDFLPEEQRVRNEIIQKLRGVFEVYGYQPLETPTICYFDILSSKYAGGAEILKEVYRLQDQGQRDIGLRYDLTVPFAKVIGMNPQIRLPFKRYEIGKVFRDGPVKPGRNREFIQCDVDVVGVSSIMAEVELMLMVSDIFKNLGLEVEIRYNNRKLLSGIIRAIGIEESLESTVMLSLDKAEKIGEAGVREELKEKGIEDSLINSLFELLNLKEEALLKFIKENTLNSLVQQGAKELEALRNYLAASEIESTYDFSPWLSRGLEIYTGTVFEVFLKDRSLSCSIGAGGRYDKIIGAFVDKGVEYPAVGLTFGLDVIYSALVNKGMTSAKPPVQVYIIPIGKQPEALKLVTELRRKGIAADMEMQERKVGKSMAYAGSLGIPYVIVLGDNEISEGRVNIRDMNNGSETNASMAGVYKYFI